MEEKKAIKISISTFFLIIAVIVIIAMGIFSFKMYNEKTVATEKSEQLQTEVNDLTGTVGDLQGKMNSVSEIINSKSDRTDEKKENVQKKSESVIETDKSKNNVGTITTFDGSKSINSNEKDYTLACQGNAGIWVEVDSTQKSLTFSFTPTRVVEVYSLTWKSNRNDMIRSKINFDKKVVDIFFGGMGQDSSGDTLFILLEDGTVEYIPIVHMFNNTQAEVTSYGKINGVSGVTKFVLSNTTNGITTLGIKNDGTFYDLWYSLEGTGNY